MKTRTKIIACLFAAYSALMLLVMFGTITHYGPFHLWIYSRLGLGAIQWVFWIDLLRKKAWAWSILSIVYVLEILLVMVGTVYYWPRAIHHFLPNLLVFLLMVVLPLWILLTDRPSMWSRPGQARDDVDKPRGEM